MIRYFILGWGVFFCVGCQSSPEKKLQRIVYIHGNEGEIRLKRGLTSYYTITLKDPENTVLLYYFNPLNDVEEMPIGRLQQYWFSSESGLSGGSPRAALAMHTADGRGVPLLLTIQNPSYDANSGELTFDGHSSQPLGQEALKTLDGKITMMIEADG